MPVEFLSDEQAARYGRCQADPNVEQLIHYFYLSPADVQFLAQLRRAANTLGCAVKLSTLRFLGTFLPELTRYPRWSCRPWPRSWVSTPMNSPGIASALWCNSTKARGGTR